MQKILLIVTLSLATFAWAQPMADNAQSADQDFYNQKVSQQADLNSNFLDATRLAASAQPESWNSSDQPGSMAANAGSQAASDDSYGQTIETQANVNRLLMNSNQQQ